MDQQVDDFLQGLDAELHKSCAPGETEEISTYPPAADTKREPEAAPAEAPKRERKRRRFEAAPPTAPVPPPVAPGSAPPQTAVQAAAQAAAAAVLAAQQGLTSGVLGTLECEVEINDCPNRVLLTRGEMHQEITDKTGAAVLLRGQYVEPGNEVPLGERKLYLRVAAPTKEKMEDAVELIKIKMEMGAEQKNLPPIIEEKLMIDVPLGLQRHQLVGKLLGPKGGNMRFVEQDTGCRIKLIGREIHEQHEPLHFLLMSDSRPAIQAAKELLTNLIQTVIGEVTQFMQPMYAPIPGYNPYGGYGVPAPMPPGPPPGGAPAPGYPPPGYDPNAAYGGYPPAPPGAPGAPPTYMPPAPGYDPNAGYGAMAPPGTAPPAPPGVDGPPGT